jgi:hypothetical protein
MTEFIGRGILEQYGQVKEIKKPILVGDVSKFLNLPKDLADNLIVVRQNRKLADGEIILNEDKIFIFFAAMGG